MWNKLLDIFVRNKKMQVMLVITDVLQVTSTGHIKF